LLHPELDRDAVRGIHAVQAGIPAHRLGARVRVHVPHALPRARVRRASRVGLPVRAESSIPGSAREIAREIAPEIAPEIAREIASEIAPEIAPDRCAESSMPASSA